MSNMPVTDQRPWEDALILAFRDMQWLKRIADVKDRESLLAQIPELLIKLDGNAESAAGDVLASQNKRYFLLEFKSGTSGLSAERKKPVYEVISRACDAASGDPDLVAKAELGHFLVFAHARGPETNKAQALLPIHNMQLNSVSYPEFTREPSGRELRKKSVAFMEVFYSADKGLSLEQMSKYLTSLATQDKSGSGDLPLNAVIASPSGLFWPGGQLLEFTKFVQALENEQKRIRALQKKFSASTPSSSGMQP